MDGYGFPGHIEPSPTVNGWWSTPDVGYRDEAGFLTVAGRADACIRTAAGHLVNPDEVAAAVESYHGIKDAAVVPLGDTIDPAVGVLVEADTTLSVDDLRRHLAAILPPWSLPRVIEAAVRDKWLALNGVSNSQGQQSVIGTLLGGALTGQITPYFKPSAQEVAALEKQIKDEHVPAIFGSEVFPSTVLAQIGRDTGAKYEATLRDDDLPGNVGGPDHSYVGLMVYDVRTMVNDLGGNPSALDGIPTHSAYD